jgi:hypothetical protein
MNPKFLSVRFWRIILGIIIGGAICVTVFVSFGLLPRHDDNSKLTHPTQSPLLSATPLNQQASLAQNLPVSPSPLVEHKEEKTAIPPKVPSAVPQLDDSTRSKMLNGLNASMKNAMRAEYGSLFQRLRVSGDLQEKVIDILTQPDRELAEQALDAAQSGSVPAPPSPETVRARQLQQDQQLRSILGDAAFSDFNQYRETFPDRMVINQMNQEGANLSQSQSEQLLGVLRQTRQQIIAPAGTTQNLNSMPPDQAMAVIQQQEVLRQQAVSNQVQNVLTPEQARTLQAVLIRPSVNQKAQ